MHDAHCIAVSLGVIYLPIVCCVLFFFFFGKYKKVKEKSPQFFVWYSIIWRPSSFVSFCRWWCETHFYNPWNIRYYRGSYFWVNFYVLAQKVWHLLPFMKQANGCWLLFLMHSSSFQFFIILFDYHASRHECFLMFCFVTKQIKLSPLFCCIYALFEKVLVGMFEIVSDIAQGFFTLLIIHIHK